MNSSATARNATAIGSGGSSASAATKASGEGAVAIGGDAVKGAQSTGKNAIAMGGQSGALADYAIAIGGQSSALGKNAIALGERSSATQDNAIAIGSGAQSTQGNSVALGVNSYADGANLQAAAYRPANTVISGDRATGEVSVGNANTGEYRRITNLAAGSAGTDAVNVSQLQAVNNSLGDRITTNANNIQKQATNLSIQQASIQNLEQGWKLQSDNDLATAVKAGDVVSINSGENIVVSRVGNELSVATKKDLSLNSIVLQDAAGNQTQIDSNGIILGNNQGAGLTLGITLDGINAGSKTITNVGAGNLAAGSTDAVNAGQLYQTNQTLSQVNQTVANQAGDIAALQQGWGIQSNGDTASSVLAGDVVQFNQGKNMVVSRDGNTLTFATADDLTLNSVEVVDGAGNSSVLNGAGLSAHNPAGDISAHYGFNGLTLVDNSGNQTVLNQNGLSFSGSQVAVGPNGLNAGGHTISQVGAGSISATSTDAINGSQLYQLQDLVNQHVADVGSELDASWGEFKQHVVLYDNPLSKDKVTLGGTLSTTPVSLTNVADGNLAAGSSDAVTGNQLFQTNQTVAQHDTAINQLNQGWNLASDTDPVQNVQAGETVTFDSGKNIDVSLNGHTITIATLDDLELNRVTFDDGAGNTSVLNASGMAVNNGAGSSAHYGADSLTFNAGSANSVSIGEVGINAGNQTITNVGNGAIDGQSTDAINGSQLYTYTTQVADLIAKADLGASILDGLVVKYDSTSQTSITLGKDGTPVSITNVAAGQIAADSTAAVNGAQLYVTNQNIVKNADDIAILNQGWNLQSNGDVADAVTAGQTVSIDAGKNMDVVRNGLTLTIATKDNMDVTTLTATDAAGNTSVLKGDGTLVSNATGDVTALYGLTGIQFTDGASGQNMTLTQTGLSFEQGGNTVSIGAAGINAGEQKITHVAAGDVANANSTDAVNGGQLYQSNANIAQNTTDIQLLNQGWKIQANGDTATAVQANDTVNFVSGKNIQINRDGHTLTIATDDVMEVTRLTAKDANGSSVLNGSGLQLTDAQGNMSVHNAEKMLFTDLAGNSSVIDRTGMTFLDQTGATMGHLSNQQLIFSSGVPGGDVYFGLNGISAGNQVIENVADGLVANGSKQAVNGGQLYALQQNIHNLNQGWGFSTEQGNAHMVGAGEVIDFSSPDKNIEISNVSGQLSFNLADEITIEKATIEDVFGNSTVLDALGASLSDAQGNTTVINAAGSTLQDAAGNTFSFNAAGSTLSNALGDTTEINATGTKVQDGLGNQAFYGALGSQFTDSLNNQHISNALGSVVSNANGDQTTVSATGSTVVNQGGAKTEITAGNTVYGDGQGSQVTIGGGGIDLGNNSITNVGKGVHAGDAVNKGQLDQAIKDFNSGINQMANSAVQYDTMPDGSINKDSITLGGGSNGTIIGNVGNGNIASGSKDAINGGQLYNALQQFTGNQNHIYDNVLGLVTKPDGTLGFDLGIYDVANQTMSNNLNLSQALNQVNQEGTKYAHTNAQNESLEPGLINPNTNSASAGGVNSSAFGVNAIVAGTATNGLAMGYQAIVGKGATNGVSVGSQTIANGVSSLAMGHGSQANGLQSISIGTGNIVNGNHSGAIGDPSYVDANNAYVIGNNNKVYADDSFVLGNNVVIDSNATNMSKANGAVFGGSLGLGSGSSVSAVVGSKSTIIAGNQYDFAGSAPVGTVSVGAEHAERTVTNVAAGRIDANSTDAINGSQLYATNQAIENLIVGNSGPVQYVKNDAGQAQNVVSLRGDADVDAPVTLRNVADGKAPTDAVNVRQMQEMGQRLDNRINDLEQETRAGTATAIAVANLPQSYLPGKSGVAMATGVYKGEVGYALGYSSISEGGKWVFKASATGNRLGDVGGGAGVLYMFD